MKINNIIRLILALALSSVISSSTASTQTSININSSFDNLSKWTFTDGTKDVTSMITSVATNPSVELAPANTYYGDNLVAQDPNYKGFWTATFTFQSTYPGSATLDISLFAADDRAQIYVNCDPSLSSPCNPIDSAGLFASTAGSQGSFQNSYPGHTTDLTYFATDGLYDNGNNNIPGDLVHVNKSATNTIEVIINNTETGIIGPLTTVGLTHFTLQGTIDFQVYPSAINEPPSFFLTLTGWLAFVMFKGKRRMTTG